jgi:hypothetical protein
MAKRLIADCKTADTRYPADAYRVAAYNVEQSLIDAGAVPGKDYSLLDVYKLAVPLVEYMLNNPDGAFLHERA